MDDVSSGQTERTTADSKLANGALVKELIPPILECSKSAALPEPWRFLRPLASIRRVLDPAALLQRLSVEFPDKDLAAAQQLCCDGVFKVLAETEGGQAFDLVSCGTRLVSNELPLVDCFRDYHTRIRIDNYKLLFVAFSPGDLTLLTQLQLPTVPATWLRDLTSAETRDLLNKSSADSPKPQTAAARRLADEKTVLHLVGANLFELRGHYSPGFLPVVARLECIERALKVDTSDRFRLLLPSAARRRRIADAVYLADEKLLRNAIVDAAKHSITVKQFHDETADEPNVGFCATFVDVRQEAQRPTRLLFAAQDLRQKFDELQRAHQKVFVDDCLKRSELSTGPVAKALWLAMSELTNMQFEASSQIAIVRNKIETGRGADDLSLAERLKIQGQLTDRIVKIARAIAEQESE